jgi:hypothetical protein
MAKSTKSTTAPAPVLAGLTAEQLNDLITQKRVTKATVIAFLTEKEAKTGRLRYPARQLLAELTGAAPAAKPVKPPAPAAKPVKPPAPAAKPAAKADDLAEIIGKAVASAVAGALVPFAARLDRVEAALAAAKPAAKAAEPVKPAKAAEPVKAKPAAKAAEPVKAKPVAKVVEPVAKPVAKAKPAKAAMSEAEARAEFASLKLAQLRDIADFDCDGMSKAEVIDEMIAQVIEEGVVIAAVPAKPAKPAAAKAQGKGKPDLKVVAREVAVEF